MNEHTNSMLSELTHLKPLSKNIDAKSSPDSKTSSTAKIIPTSFNPEVQIRLRHRHSKPHIHQGKTFDFNESRFIQPEFTKR